MKVSVHSLKHTLFQGEAKSITCETVTGQITILDNHEPLITVLKEGILKIEEEGNKEKFIQVKDGFVEVRAGSEVKCIIQEVDTK